MTAQSTTRTPGRLGRVALVGGLVAATGIVALIATQAPGILPFTGGLSPEQAQAMHRDLGLSEQEAALLLDRQAEAAAARERLRGELGELVDNSYFDPKAGKLIVNITDPTLADKIRDEDVEPRDVDNSLADLEKVTEKLAENTAPRDVASWYIDPVSNTVVIAALPGKHETAVALAEKAGVPKREITIKEAEFAPQAVTGTPVTELTGGEAYFTSERKSCSIGVPVVDRTGAAGFVTAGHCGAPGTRVSSTLSGPAWGTIAEAVFPGHMDASWVRVPGGRSSALVNDFQGGSVTVNGTAETLINGTVCRYGATTKWRCGKVLAKDVVVDYGSLGKVTGLTKTDACADIGDSGGAVLSGDQAQGVVSGVEGGCARGGHVVYYQEINQILRTWQLTIPGQKGPPGPPPTTASQSPVPVTTRPTSSTPTTGVTSTDVPVPTSVTATSPAPDPGCPSHEESATLPADGLDTRPARPDDTGRFTACLSGPDGAGLDLVLERQLGRSWQVIAESLTPGSTERISVTGEKGEYRWRIQAVSGPSGQAPVTFTLRTDGP